MQYKKIGTSDLSASEVCLGTMTWGNQNTEEEAFEQLDYALTQGVNFIDTAEMYPIPPKKERQGGTETIIGRWMKERNNRSDIILASKVAGPSSAISTRDIPVSLSRNNVFAAIDTSLSRLQTDYLDLYQVHWPQRNTNFFGKRSFDGPLEEDVVTLQETLEALSEVVKAGKVRYIGISNETPWGVHEYLRLSKEMNLPRIVSIQNQYSLTNRTYEIGLAELCMRENISLLAYSCIDGGALSGKYLGGAKPEGARFYLPDYTQANFMRYNAPYAQGAIQSYVDIAKKHGLDPVQMALAFVFKRPCMGSVIIGATSIPQLKVNIDAATIPLSEEVMTDIHHVYMTMPDPHA